MNIFTRIRAGLRGLPEAAQAEERSPRFGDWLKTGASSTNPYHPSEGNTGFPSVPVPGKRFMPPSVNPQMVIRQGATPLPSGPTVPQGTVHPNGSK